MEVDEDAELIAKLLAEDADNIEAQKLQ